MKKKTRPRKGVVAYFLVFVLLSIVTLFLFAFAIPLSINITAAFYSAGEDILDGTDTWINKIDNSSVRTEINDTLNNAKDTIPEQIELLTFFFQYSWLIIIIVIVFVIFMMTRTTVEQELRIR